MLNRLALPPTPIAMRLHLLKYPRRQHMFLHHDAPPPTLPARIHRAVRTPAPLALLANLLLFDGKFVVVAGVEIAQGDRDVDFHVGAAPLAGLLAEVAGAAEEAAEEVEGVVAAAAGAAALFVLGEAVGAVLVVDFAVFGGGEGVVGFGDLGEFFRGGGVAAG